MIEELFPKNEFPSPSGNIIDKLNEVIRALNAAELAATDSQQLKQAISLVRQQALVHGLGSGIAFTGKDLLDSLEKTACV